MELKSTFSLPRMRMLIPAAALLLSGCLGGGGGGTGTTLSGGTLNGVAAVGSPIVNGTISIVCATGSALSTTTNATGAWQAALAGQTLPCAIRVAGGTVDNAANSASYHSIAIAAGTINVTPLTDLIVANLAASAAPATWFAGLGTSPAALASINQAGVDAALARMRTALNSLPPLGTVNPVTATFTAAPGNQMDDMLSALKTALSNAGVSYAALLSNAAQPAFIVPSGFGTVLGNAYAGTSSGGGNNGGGNNGGNFTLTVTVTAGGVAGATVVIDNVPKPATQAEFCADASVQGALNNAATGGTLTINSCTFNGTTGSISATLNITTPVAISVPYTVNYSYSGGGTGNGGGNNNGGGNGGISAPLTQSATYTMGYAGAICQNRATCDIGLDTRPITATFATGGQLTGYTFTLNASSEALNLGGATVSDLGGNADLTWGRWNDGQLGGVYFSTQISTPLFASQGFHYVVGNATPALPAAGTATYRAIAATSPTSSASGANGGVAAVNLAGSSVAVDFAANKVGFDVAFSYTTPASTTYRLTSAGGSSNVATSAFSFLPSSNGYRVVGSQGANAVDVIVNGTSGGTTFSADTFVNLIPYGANAQYLAMIFHDHNFNAGVVIFQKN